MFHILLGPSWRERGSANTHFLKHLTSFSRLQQKVEVGETGWNGWNITDFCTNPRINGKKRCSLKFCTDVYSHFDIPTKINDLRCRGFFDSASRTKPTNFEVARHKKPLEGSGTRLITPNIHLVAVILEKLRI